MGTDPEGAAIYKYAAAPTKKALAAAKEELQKKYVNGPEAVDRDAMFGDRCTEYWETVRKPRVKSASGRASLASAMNKHILPVFGSRIMRSITYKELQDFINGLQGKSSSVIGDVLSILHGVFGIATAERVIDVDISLPLRRPVTEKRKRRELTDAELAAVFKLMREQDSKYRQLLGLLLYTGARRGEILGLRWSDIDFKANQIRICRDIDYAAGDVGTVKTPSSIRTIPLMVELQEILLPLRQLDGYLIHAPLGTGEDWLPKKTYDRLTYNMRIDLYRLDPTMESVELSHPDATRDRQHKPERGSVLTAHYFRHNYASVLYDAGVDVKTAQRYLGHASITTTLNIYTHLAEKRKQLSEAAARAAFSALKGATKVQPYFFSGVICTDNKT